MAKLRKLDPYRIGRVALIVISGVVLIPVFVTLRQSRAVYSLTLAAGSEHGESYVIGQALRSVVHRHEPRIRIRLMQTAGTNENLSLLENGQAQLAAAQADVPAGPSARIVANLFTDVFQLLVPGASPVAGFSDLRGRRIALPPRGGQYSSFLNIAEHYGLKSSDFVFIGEDDHSAEEAFQRQEADALFHVRALAHPSLLNLVRKGQARFVPIEQAAAMKLKFPALDPSMIPQGAYLGNPPVPASDLPSVGVHRTLLAHRNLDPYVVRTVTRILMEQRQEIAEAIPERSASVRPLLAAVRAPDPQPGLGAAVHAGAQDYYDRDKPSFVIEHADYLSLIVTVILLGGSWLWELKRFVERRQKNQADLYSTRVIGIMNQARTSAGTEELPKLRSQLLDLLTLAVDDLDHDKISAESFQSFRVIFQIAMDVVQQAEAAGAPAAGVSNEV